MKHLILMVSTVLVFTSCSKNDGLTQIVTGDRNAKMSAKPTAPGVITGRNLIRAASTAAGINAQSNANAFNTFQEQENSFSTNGGIQVDTETYKANIAFLFTMALETVKADSAKAPWLRKIPTDTTTAITVSGNDTLSDPVLNAVAGALVKNFTGLDAKPEEITILANLMRTMKTSVANTAAGKQLVVASALAATWVVNSWQGAVEL